MRMGDMSSPVRGKDIDNHHDGAQISWNNCIRDTPNPVTIQDQPNDDWKVTFSPHGAFIKNRKGSSVQSIEPYERSQQRDSFLHKSTNWKDLVAVTSPLVSSFLAKSNPHPSADIDVLGPAVQKLTTEAENLPSSKNTEPEKSKGKLLRAGDSSATLTRQTAKSKMLAEIQRRRRAKAEEEKKMSKPPKDDSSRGNKSCTMCGVSMADGPRNICKSCMNRQKRDKSRDKSQVREVKPKIKSSPTPSPKKEDTFNSEVDSTNDDIYYKCQSPLGKARLLDEPPTKNRSLSMDNTDTYTETSAKYSPQKRTNTDLGPNSISKSKQDKGMNDVTQTSPTGSYSKRSPMTRHVSPRHGSNPATDRGKEVAFPSAKISGVGSRVMKRSTTDSEIVSKSKLIKKPITGEDHKTTFVNTTSRQQSIDDSKQRTSPRMDKKEMSGISSKHSSLEAMNSGMKLERSKTVMGKMNVDGDKKTLVDIDRTRKKEGSNVSAESEKSYSTKKFTNPARSHTIIGDGIKRQKNKGDWNKLKGVKMDSRDARKRMDKRGSPTEEDGRRVSFVEGEAIKKLENEEVIMVGAAHALPLNLYDYVPEDDEDSSSDESSCDLTSVGKLSETSLSSRTEIPAAIRSRDIPMKTSRYETKSRESNVKRSWNNRQDNTSVSSAKHERSHPVTNQYESIQSRMAPEPETNLRASRWSEENATAVDYEAMFDYSGYDTDYEEQAIGDDCSECSYSEHYKALGRIEEENEGDEHNHDDGNVDGDSEAEIYTRYPAQQANQDDKDHHSGIENEIPSTESYFGASLPNRDLSLKHSKGKEGEEEWYTTHAVSNRAVEPYDANRDVSPTQAAYTEQTGHWTQAMIGNGDTASSYFNAYETDVDTGLSVLHPQNEKKKENTGYGWGFSRYDNSDSSSSSDDDDDHVRCSDSWYTGGYYDQKSEAGLNNDDLVYYNDKAAKKLSESELYTGDLYSSAKAKGNDPTDISMNNNMTLEDNQGSNFWIISSRPQMHQMNLDQLSSPNWVKGHCGNITYLENLTAPVCDLSNNNNEDDEPKPSICGGFNGKLSMQIACKSDYTEYTPELTSSVKTKRPKKEIVLLGGGRDFTKYDMLDREVREERVLVRSSEYPKSDPLFFGDEPPRVPKHNVAKSRAEHNTLYFNNALTPVMCADSSPEQIRPHYPKEDDYQGGFYCTSRYAGSNNSNNNNDYESDSYTGCFKNEEEYKPTHDGLFNDRASSFVFQKRAPEYTPLYFCNVSSKSYYDTEESVYAFERKIEKIIKPPEPPKILKVGSIVVRNNVECEVDYAQNIDMDSQEVPKTWMRYDYGGDSNVADTSSYAQNVSFEEFGGAKPWVVEGCRAPWKMTSREKKGKDEIINKNSNGSWKAAPDKMVKSVKSLGSYVTKWF